MRPFFSQRLRVSREMPMSFADSAGGKKSSGFSGCLPCIVAQSSILVLHMQA